MWWVDGKKKKKKYFGKKSSDKKNEWRPNSRQRTVMPHVDKVKTGKKKRKIKTKRSHVLILYEKNKNCIDNQHDYN